MGSTGFWGESIGLGESGVGVCWGKSGSGRVVDNDQPALGSMIGINGSAHKTRMCTPWEFHHLRIAKLKVPQRLSCRACQLPNVENSRLCELRIDYLIEGG